VLDIHENRAPLASLCLWVFVFLLDGLIGPFLSLSQAAAPYYILVFTASLVILPLYLSSRWNIGEAGIFLGFSLIFWSVGDFACSFFSLGSGGFCYLLRQWYPIQFLIVMRLFGGSILVMYLVLNPDVGTEAAALPALRGDEVRWFLKASLVLLLLLVGSFVLFRSLSRAEFEGDVIYVLTGAYRSLDSPELVYAGIMAKYPDEKLGYLLVREHLNMTNLPIGQMAGVSWETDVFEGYLWVEVEILGKLSEFDPTTPRVLFPGRIREAQD
jgi:hypothetical protein